ncbi:MAG: dTMP kinase [Rothia sp. (in: high G+C Gram-positive bacteria)]|uniref:dTMP kinase n=1 Tax=Rothia sp. (in: high G+C Gram-positive bacteria) TaxID=1885016 RepID=UPI0026DFAB04|nr:dTMP kinase [Rothia sp. (in: high G+C Gram-positive bacteria)]MDO5750579.1 dTMP kinase [Rothia sp. (in: high G+C Gram-positive bacteria)]
MSDSLRYSPDSSVSVSARPGLFIVVEGGDGAGKSTQLSLLHRELESRGYTVISTREPGGTELGEALRALVLHGDHPVDARTEALIFAASRAAHVAQKIAPALDSGSIVLCDRYIASSAAYQGAGRELGVESIVDLSRWATNDFQPDMTLVFELPDEEQALRRAERGTVDRIEAENSEFKQRIAGFFKDYAVSEDPSVHRVDASGSIEQVAQRVWALVEPALKHASLSHVNSVEGEK